MSISNVLWTSPIASQEIEEGPELSIAPGKVVLRYRGADQVLAYDSLLDLGTTSSLAGQIIGNARRGAAGMRHLRIFLDDVGAYDIIARKVTVP